jgi:hypothetical protein
LNLDLRPGSVEEFGQPLIFLAFPLGAGEGDDHLAG